MQRHVDRAARQDRHVGDEPFEAILRQDRDAVAGLHAMLHQPRGTGRDLIVIFIPAQVVIQPVLLEADGDARAEPLGLPTKQSRHRIGVHDSSA